ncbi:MAG TPA: tail fiber protein, partial [Clostridia bacterium]|nr:tail fiber protein [Clostridia bacterium]
NGRFNVILGPVDESGRSIADAFRGNDRFLEIRVKGNRPILPRQQILSAPFAFYSQDAERAKLADALVKELADALCPVGSIMAFAGPTNTIPDGWLLCDGRATVSTNYPRLFAAIGTCWGDGSFDSNNLAENPPNPATDFNLPDLRGLFLRGANLNSTNALTDPNATTRAASRVGGNSANAVGSVQLDDFKSHNHPFNYNIVRAGCGFDGGNNSAPYEDSGHPQKLLTVNTGGLETRPKNAFVNYIIKY